MTDNERNRIDAICKIANIKDIGDLSDGFHTFNQLYYQRMMLFATIVKQNKDKAWKSLRHEDGEPCFGGGWFIVGVTTPEGDYTYHYEKQYYNLFDCQELECGKHWDGHTEEDVTRLFSLPSVQPEMPTHGSIKTEICENSTDGTTDDCISRQDVVNLLNEWHDVYVDACHNQTASDLDLIIKELKALPAVQPDRDIPQKPYEEIDHTWGIPRKQPVCPNCDSYLTITHFFGEGKKVSYCEHCGQAIDWSEWEVEHERR